MIRPEDRVQLNKQGYDEGYTDLDLPPGSVVDRVDYCKIYKGSGAWGDYGLISPQFLEPYDASSSTDLKVKVIIDQATQDLDALIGVVKRK